MGLGSHKRSWWTTPLTSTYYGRPCAVIAVCIGSAPACWSSERLMRIGFVVEMGKNVTEVSVTVRGGRLNGNEGPNASRACIRIVEKQLKTGFMTK